MSELATISRERAVGMITVRGDLAGRPVRRAVKAACGHKIPASGQIFGAGERAVAWMSPDELLVMVPYASVEQVMADMEKALKGAHALIVDVSDARALFRIDGADAREVLARLCPVDLHEQSFAIGQFRRTRMAQVAAAFWRHETGFDVICFRSVADYMDGLLRNAAKGAKVGALD